MVRPSRPAPLLLEEPFMLFSGGNSEDTVDSRTVSNGPSPTILSPCSLTSPKALAAASVTSTEGRAPPPGASPRHLDEDQTGSQEDGDDSSSVASNSTPRVHTGRTPTFAFFKRSFSASASLSGMGSNGHGSVSANTTPSARGVTGLKIKPKRGFPTLTPRGNSSLPPTGITPRNLPSGRQVTSPASFGGLLARLRRLSTVPADEDSSTSTSNSGTDPPATREEHGNSSNDSTTTTMPCTTSGGLGERETSRGRTELTRRASAPPQPLGLPSMSLATMDFHYDGNKILDYLYVGGESIPSQDALAETFNITHIVNTTMKGFYPHHDPTDGDYVQLFMLDAMSQDIDQKRLDAAFNMIEKARAKGHACLVHCRNGMSRSTSICIAYLMRYYKMPLLEAFNFVRERRPCTSPNPGFMRQLAVYENEWLGFNSLDVDHYADDRFGSIRELSLKRKQQKAAQKLAAEKRPVEEVEEEEEEEVEEEAEVEEEEEEEEEPSTDSSCTLSSSSSSADSSTGISAGAPSPE